MENIKKVQNENVPLLLQSCGFLFFLGVALRRATFCRRPSCIIFPPASNKDNAEAVVVLHGLGRTAMSMLIPAMRLRANGYTVFLPDYPSTNADIRQHANTLVNLIKIIKTQNDFKKINFLAHSLGCIIIRAAFANFAEIMPDGRTVMIAPPNRGSRMASRAAKIPFLRKILKPLCELRSEKGSFAASLPMPSFEHGVIAGNYDAKVRPDEAVSGSEKDFLLLNSFHSFIMNRKDVMQAALNFYKTGKFGD
jgi:pimeloyl-ACP methyl ester carboxylesterase